jgi:DNA-binding SARP family transcriptional activator/DNA-binding CsgD family transcriptional regulator
MDFSVLGPLEIADSGRPVELRAAKQLIMLAVLLCHANTPVSVDRLMDALWGPRPPRTALENLRVYIHHLRRALGDDRRIVRTPPGYALVVRPGELDAARFQSMAEQGQQALAAGDAATAAGVLRRGLMLWRGQPYAGLDQVGVLRDEASRLEQCRQAVLETRIEADLAMGRHGEVIAELSGLVSRYPLRERLRGQLMLALYRTGRQAEALHVYRDTRRLLIDELGLEPGPELRLLEQAILTADPILRLPDTGHAGITAGSAAAPRIEVAEGAGRHGGRAVEQRRPDLLEREEQCRILREAADAAGRGSGRCVLLEGAPGLGKTRLLAEATEIAATAQLRVLRGRGTELEQGFGFGVVHQLFGPVVNAADDDTRRSLFEGAAAKASALLGQPGAPESPTGDFATMHGLYWLTANLCRRGAVAFVVDDLHWADTAMLRFLAYLLPRLDGLPLLLVAGARPRPPGCEPVLDHLFTDSQTTALGLVPLSEAASARVVRQWIDSPVDDAFCTVCHELTGGNPLLLRELATAAARESVTSAADLAGRLRAIGGNAIGRRVAQQLSRLPPAATEVARATAVLDDGAPVGDLAAVTGLDIADVLAAVADLAAADILRGGDTAEFVHPLVRSAVYDQMGPVHRAGLHSEAAGMLHRAGASAQRVAAHLLAVPPAGDPAVLDLLRRGAIEAVGTAAPKSALAYLERALQEPPGSQDERTALWTEAGAVALRVDPHQAAEHLTRALAATSDPHQRGQTARMLGQALFMSTGYREAVTVYEQAIPDLGPEHADLRRRLQASMIGATLGDVSTCHRAGELVTALRRGPRDGGLGSRMLTATIAWYDGISALDIGSAERGAHEALADGILTEANGADSFIAACAVLINADRDEVMPTLDAALARAYREGETSSAALVTCFRAQAWLCRGSLAEAEADGREAIRLIDVAGIDLTRPYAAGHLSETLMERGRLEEAQRVQERAYRSPQGPRDATSYWLMLSRGCLLLQQGHVPQGLDLILECGRRLEAHGWHNPAFLGWRSQAIPALQLLGRYRDAEALTAEDLRLARAWAAPRALGRALRVAGQLAGGARGLSLLEEAVGVLDTSPAQLERAKALYALGSVLRRRGENPAACAHLAPALDIADRCGATPLVRQIRREMRAAGGRPRRTALSGPVALTPSERRIAELAAAGHTNPAIAQTLLVTPKTVEVHLESAYRKLRVKNRAEMKAIIEQHGRDAKTH